MNPDTSTWECGNFETSREMPCSPWATVNVQYDDNTFDLNIIANQVNWVYVVRYDVLIPF